MQVVLKDMEQVSLRVDESIGGLFVRFDMAGIARLDGVLDKELLQKECRPIEMIINTTTMKDDFDGNIERRDVPQKHTLETAGEQARVMARLVFSSMPNLEEVLKKALKAPDAEGIVFDLACITSAYMFWRMGRSLIQDEEV